MIRNHRLAGLIAATVVTSIESEEVQVMDIDEVSTNYEDATQAIDENQADLGQLEALKDSLESYIDYISQEGTDGQTLKAVRFAVYERLGSVGLSSIGESVSLESAGELTQEELVASLEGIVGNITQGISNVIHKTGKAISDFFTFRDASIRRLGEKAEEVLMAVDGKKPSKETVRGTDLHALTYKNSLATKDVLAGYKEVTDLSDKILSTAATASGAMYKLWLSALAKSATYFDKVVLRTSQVLAILKIFMGHSHAQHADGVVALMKAASMFMGGRYNEFKAVAEDLNKAYRKNRDTLVGILDGRSFIGGFVFRTNEADDDVVKFDRKRVVKTDASGQIPVLSPAELKACVAAIKGSRSGFAGPDKVFGKAAAAFYKDVAKVSEEFLTGNPDEDSKIQAAFANFADDMVNHSYRVFWSPAVEVAKVQHSAARALYKHIKRSAATYK